MHSYFELNALPLDIQTSQKDLQENHCYSLNPINDKTQSYIARMTLWNGDCVLVDAALEDLPQGQPEALDNRYSLSGGERNY